MASDQSSGFQMIDDYMRGARLGQALGRANASSTAQTSGDGLGIENLRRGVLSVLSSGADTTVTAGAADVWTPLDTPLEGDIYLSGRPLLLMVNVIISNLGGVTSVSLLLRGDEVTGRHNGIVATSATTLDTHSGFWLVAAPAPGIAHVEMVANAITANGTVATDAAYNATALLAVEL